MAKEASISKCQEQEIRDRSLLVRVKGAPDSESIKGKVAAAGGLSLSDMQIVHVHKKSTAVSYAAAATGVDSKGSSGAVSVGSSNRGGPASSSDRSDGALFRITFISQYAAKKVLFARKSLKGDGVRVEEALNAEELALKKEYLRAGVPNKVWEAEKAVTSWRKGQLVKLLKGKWVSVPLDYSP
jgi:hypothetical protein